MGDRCSCYLDCVPFKGDDSRHFGVFRGSHPNFLEKKVQRQSLPSCIWRRTAPTHKDEAFTSKKKGWRMSGRIRVDTERKAILSLKKASTASGGQVPVRVKEVN